MPLATGTYKKLYLAKQAGLGVKALPNAATARSVRRVTSTLDLNRGNFTSAEQNESQQDRDMRLGVKGVAGTLTGEYSVGGYQLPFESVLRQLSQAGVTSGAIATTSMTAGAAGSRIGTVARTAGSWLTDGFKRGDVIMQTGWTTGAVVNNNRLMVIIDIASALSMTVLMVDKGDPFTKVAGDPVVTAVAGRKIWTPQTGHTRDYYTIEHWFSDVPSDEMFRDCVFTGATLTLPPTGMATVAMPIMGLGMDTDVVQYFTSPAAAPIGGLLASTNGVLMMNGAVAAIVTGLTITIAGNHSVPGGVVGADENPDIFPGKVTVTGSLTALFKDTSFRDAFLNETESQLTSVLKATSALNSPFEAINMSRIKYTGASKDDTPAGLTQTLPFTALENVLGGAAVKDLPTSISIQGSAYV